MHTLVGRVRDGWRSGPADRGDIVRGASSCASLRAPMEGGGGRRGGRRGGDGEEEKDRRGRGVEREEGGGVVVWFVLVRFGSVLSCFLILLCVLYVYCVVFCLWVSWFVG